MSTNQPISRTRQTPHARLNGMDRPADGHTEHTSVSCLLAVAAACVWATQSTIVGHGQTARCHLCGVDAGVPLAQCCASLAMKVVHHEARRLATWPFPDSARCKGNHAAIVSKAQHLLTIKRHGAACDLDTPRRRCSCCVAGKAIQDTFEGRCVMRGHNEVNGASRVCHVDARVLQLNVTSGGRLRLLTRNTTKPAMCW